MSEATFIQALKDAGICGGRIWAVKAPSGTAYPYSIYTVNRNTLTDDLESSEGSRNRYFFTSWHETYQDAVDTLALFRTTAKPYGYSVSGAFIDIDPDTLKFRLTNNDYSIIET